MDARGTGWSLAEAAGRGNVERVKTILNGLKECTHTDTRSGCECFHVSEQRHGGTTALMVAAKAGHADVVRLLLQGSKVNLRARDDATGQAVLAMAAAEGHEAVVETLLASPAVAVNCKSTDWKTPLSLAAEGGHEGVVKLLLGEKDVVVNLRDIDRETALTLAAERGHECVVRLLLAAGADVNVLSLADGLTALMKAAEKGHGAVVKVILENGGGDVNVNSTRGRMRGRGKDKGKQVYGGGETALMLASVGGHVNIVESLLGHGADVSIKTEDGKSDALLLALKNEKWSVAKMLVEAGGADLQTVLMWGCETGNYSVVSFAARCGVDLNRMAGRNSGSTPLAVAALGGHRDVASLLITKGADSKDAFVWAAGAGHLEAVKLLYAEGAEDRDAALSAAARFGHKHVAAYLLSVGADVNGCERLRNMPLKEAADCGSTDVAKLLLEHGADVNAKNCVDRTALYYAAWSGHYGVVSLLLDNGADVNVRCKNGRTALSRARGCKLKEVEALLLSKGAVE